MISLLLAHLFIMIVHNDSDAPIRDLKDLLNIEKGINRNMIECRRWIMATILVLGLILSLADSASIVPPVSAQLMIFGATRAPSIDVDQNDRLYLAMSVATSSTGPPHSQIFFTKSFDGGATWDNLPRTLNLSNSPGEAFGPSLAVTKAGKVKVYMTYHDSTIGATQSILVRSKKRTNFRPPVDISAGNGGAFSPRVAVDAAGSVNVVWGDTTGGGRRVVFVRSNDSGITFSPKLVVSNLSSIAFDPDVAVETTTGVINVVWQEAGPLHTVIMFSKSVDFGLTFSGAVQVSADIGNAGEPRIVRDAAGGIQVAWVQQTGADHQIAYSRSLDGGSTFSTPELLTNTPGAEIHKPAMATLGQLVCIAYHDESDSSRQVFVLRSNNLGARFTSAVQVSDAGRRRGLAHSPALVFDSTGRIHIVWIDSSILGSDEGILLYSSSPDGNRFTAQRMLLAAIS